MIELDEEKTSQFKISNIIAISMLIAAPLIYLLIAYLVKIPLKSNGEQQILLYMLFIIGIIQPMLLPVIEKLQINSYKTNVESSITPARFFTLVSIIRSAFIEAIYIYGLIVYFLSGNIISMLYFYPVGIIWSFVYWPKKTTFEKFLQKVERNEPYLSA